ncbi:unnamed protein product, partial [Dicrocoelium dendriticum]
MSVRVNGGSSEVGVRCAVYDSLFIECRAGCISASRWSGLVGLQKNWLVQKKADRTSTSAAAKRCAWEWSLPPPHPAPRQSDPRPTKKTTTVPRRSDPRLAEKRSSSRGEATLVSRRSDPRPAEKRSS